LLLWTEAQTQLIPAKTDQPNELPRDPSNPQAKPVQTAETTKTAHSQGYTAAAAYAHVPPSGSGEITLDWDTLIFDADPDQQLIVYAVEPDTPSHQVLRIPRLLAANEHQPARSSAS
jgi:hypothetical protein